MNKELIYYHCSDINDDGTLEIELTPDLKKKYQSKGFRIHEPKNANEFISILQNLRHEDTTLHIHAHGNGIQISPMTIAQRDKFEQIGFPVEFNSVLVSYNQIQQNLQALYPSNKLILNMMAVCDSATVQVIASTWFLGTNSSNNDLDESFEIYLVDEGNYQNKIDELNKSRGEEIYVAIGAEDQQ